MMNFLETGLDLMGKTRVYHDPLCIQLYVRYYWPVLLADFSGCTAVDGERT